MAQPSLHDVHYNRPMGTLSVAVLQDIAADYIAEQCFPTVACQKQSDRYYKYNRDYFLRAEATIRAPATESAGSGWSLSANDHYFCDIWAFHTDVPNDLYNNADEGIDIDRDALLLVNRNIKLRQEKQFMTRFFTPGVWGGLVTTNSAGQLAPEDFSPSVSWAADNSNPANDISKLRIEMKRNTGMKPNKLIVAEDVHERLMQHPFVLNRLANTTLRVATEQLLAELFAVDKYIVASAIINSAAEGLVGQYNFMCAGTFLLCYAPAQVGLMSATAGATFLWTGRNGASPLGSLVRNIPQPNLNATRIESEICFDQKIVCPELGTFGANVLG